MEIKVVSMTDVIGPYLKLLITNLLTSSNRENNGCHLVEIVKSSALKIRDLRFE